MIHTIELQTQIPNEIFYILNRKRLPEERWNNRIIFNDGTGRYSTTDIRKGIRKIIVYKTGDKATHSEATWILLQLNVSRLLGYAEPRRPIRIKEEDLPKLNDRIQTVKELIYKQLQEETGVDCRTFGRDFYIRRVDYAIDVVLEKDGLADEYIRLLKKGYRDRWLSRFYSGENYYVTNGASRKSYRRAINCYNKTAFERKKGNFDVADRLLRFEVQLGYKQIKKFADKYGLNNYAEYQQTNDYSLIFKLSPYILKDYHDRISEPLQYYKKRDIIKIIKAASIGTEFRGRVVKYLNAISRSSGSLNKMKMKYAEEIDWLKSIGINPVPLGSKAPVKTLKSLSWYIENKAEVVEDAQRSQAVKRKKAVKRVGRFFGENNRNGARGQVS